MKTETVLMIMNETTFEPAHEKIVLTAKAQASLCIPTVSPELSLFAHTINQPSHEKICLMSYASNKGADQPAHPRSLISAFVVCCLESIISLDSTAQISRLC